VEIADDGGDATSEVTIGELAYEALDLLEPSDEGEDGDGKPGSAS
jgi:hypothetical protein